MKLTSVEIENYRGIESLDLPLDPQMTVLFGPNGCGKTSVLTAIAIPLDAGADSIYKRVALDRRVSVEDNPTISVAGCEEGAIPDDRRIRASVRTFPDSNEVMDGNPHRGEWNVDYRGLQPPKARFYDIDREVISSLFGRHVSSTPDFDQLFEWFYTMEYRELRAERDGGNANEIGLSAVRLAICRMLDDVADPRIGPSDDPPRLVVNKQEAGSERTLAFEQLSDGYRGVLALVADIARHMPHTQSDDSADLLAGETVVLIDEIELHLHPKWQQRILPDLMRTFPNAQFVVSTHSPQVLTTVRPEQIVELGWDEGHIVAREASASTYGAEAGYALSVLMDVEKRPPNDFAKKLRKYMGLIDDGKGDSDDARSLRQELEELSPGDLGFLRADAEIRRQRMNRGTGDS